MEGAVDSLPGGHWLGAVIPKRHARRSVTRNLLRRQIRAVMSDQLETLPAGLWLVRLRSPFAKAEFVSAASPLLRQAARAELQQLFTRAAQQPTSRQPA
jgi:ribonuclease P protein component